MESRSFFLFRGSFVGAKHTQIMFWVVVSNNFFFSPLVGDIIQFDKYFSKGLKPPTSGGSGNTPITNGGKGLPGRSFCVLPCWMAPVS